MNMYLTLTLIKSVFRAVYHLLHISNPRELPKVWFFAAVNHLHVLFFEAYLKRSC